MNGKKLLYALALLTLIIASCDRKNLRAINEEVNVEMPAQQEEPAPQEDLLRTEPITELDMVFVEGGTMVIQGKEVTLDSFFMNKYALTYYIYAKVHNWAYEKGYSVMYDRPMILSSSDEEEIVLLNWSRAIVTCNYLSIMEGLTPVYMRENKTEPILYSDDIIEVIQDWYLTAAAEPFLVYHPFYINWDANGYRLPTEAEWEFAARGGNKSMGYTYSGSDTLADVSSYRDYDFEMNYSPGQKKPNELGIHDMSNRASEWCIEPWAEPASMEPAHNPGRLAEYNLTGAFFLILKGGHVHMGQDSYRPQARIKSHPDSDRVDDGRYLTTASMRLVRNQ